MSGAELEQWISDHGDDTEDRPCGASLTARCFSGDAGCPTHPNWEDQPTGQGHPDGWPE